jgi:tetratricopeptide (TPR) repeat protein
VHGQPDSINKKTANRMNTYDYDMISRYVDGEMTAEEKQAFEQQLMQDAELKKEVELYREVNVALQSQLHPDEGEKALRLTLEDLRQQHFKTSGAKVIQMRRNRWLAAAAAAAVILAVLIWSPWIQFDLYSQFAQIEMSTMAERGTPADSLKQEVVQKFNNKKFEEAIPMFETILAQDSADAYHRYFYAIALLETDQVEKSRAELTQLYNGTSIYRYDAAYYMALSYLKQKDRTTCTQWLSRIPEDAEIYSRSERLMKKL